MEMIFESLKLKDIEKVADLYDAERSNNKTNRQKMIQICKEIKNNPDYFMIVAKVEKEIVGFAKVILNHDIFEEGKPFLTVWSIRVDKKYRRQNIGAKMFKYIEQLAKERDCAFIALISEKKNTSANKFYERQGYKKENGFVKYI